MTRHATLVLVVLVLGLLFTGCSNRCNDCYCYPHYRPYYYNCGAAASYRAPCYAPCRPCTTYHYCY